MRGQEEGKTKDQILEEALGSDYDVLALTRRQNPVKGPDQHFMLRKLENWHPGSLETLLMIFKEIGLEWWERREPKDPIYQNHFVARGEIYREYVQTVLIPAMWLMENHEPIRKRCYEDSGYYKLKTDVSYPRLIKDQLGMDYVPMHTFLCERMFSCWIEGKKLNIKYL